MKISVALLLTVVALLFSTACSMSLREILETKDVNEDYEDEGNQADLQKRGYYWIVSDWGPCQCQDDEETGVQYRVVSCTKKPCHFIRAPRFKQVCQCHQ
ncbi:hypothetical protein ACROYT_G024492 [Oculina patagonica]